VHQVGDQTKLYYDARSTNHQDFSASWKDIPGIVTLQPVVKYAYDCSGIWLSFSNVLSIPVSLYAAFFINCLINRSILKQGCWISEKRILYLKVIVYSLTWGTQKSLQTECISRMT